MIGENLYFCFSRIRIIIWNQRSKNPFKLLTIGVNPKSWTTNWRGFSYETDI